MVKMCHIVKLEKQYQFTLILSKLIFNKIQDTFVPNKPFCSLLEIYPKDHIFLKTFNSEFQTTEVWFTDQNSQSLEIEDNINLTLVIK